MIKLSVNINKLATLRNSRGENNPNLIDYTKKILALGVDSITIHPRPDERHITLQDVFELSDFFSQLSQKIEFNIEGFPDDRYVEILSKVRPTQATLVPDSPEVLTSNAGWSITSNQEFLHRIFTKIRPYVQRISLFVDVNNINAREIEFLKEEKIQRVELYTQEFAENFKNNDTLRKYYQCSRMLLAAGLELNAGHDLNLENLPTLIKTIPEIKEVSIGHALFCESLLYSMPTTINRYLNILRDNNHG